jgi:hypothetical protein
MTSLSDSPSTLPLHNISITWVFGRHQIIINVAGGTCRGRPFTVQEPDYGPLTYNSLYFTPATASTLLDQLINHQVQTLLCYTGIRRRIRKIRTITVSLAELRQPLQSAGTASPDPCSPSNTFQIAIKSPVLRTA